MSARGTGGLDEATLDLLNAEIDRRLRADTAFVPSTTRVAGKLAIRPCYINPLTTLAEVEGLARAVRAIGDAAGNHYAPRSRPTDAR